MNQYSYWSLAYRLLRSVLKRVVYVYQMVYRLPRDFETVVQIGEQLVKLLLVPGIRSLVTSTLPRHPIKVGPVTFLNPVTFAAFQGDLNQLELWLRLGIGGGCFKTITPEVRLGNDRPRIQEFCLDGQLSLLNAYGLPGKGVDQFLVDVHSKDLFKFKAPLGISLGGHCREDYLYVYRKVLQWMVSENLNETQLYVEVNMSCPNTPSGQDLSNNLDHLKQLLTAMRAESQLLIGVKVSPDQTDSRLLSIVHCLSLFPNTYINAGNTQFKTCEMVGLSSSDISIGGGGLSGGLLYKRTLEMVKLLSPVGVPVMATGGISSIQQIREVLNAGAMLVGIATALVRDPFQIPNWTKTELV